MKCPCCHAPEGTCHSTGCPCAIDGSGHSTPQYIRWTADQVWARDNSEPSPRSIFADRDIATSGFAQVITDNGHTVERVRARPTPQLTPLEYIYEGTINWWNGKTIVGEQHILSSITQAQRTVGLIITLPQPFKWNSISIVYKRQD